MSAGRPTVWTPEVEQTILDAVRVGCSYVIAARAAGISRETLHARLREDQAFSDRVEIARSKGVVNVAHEAACTTDNVRLKYAIHFLSVKDPDEFALKNRLELSGKVDIGTALASALAADPGEPAALYESSDSSSDSPSAEADKADVDNSDPGDES